MKAPSDMRIARGRVAAGAAYLDVVVGEDWVDKIDLKQLDLASTTSCVIGQLVGDYLTTAVGLTVGGAILGFDLGDEDVDFDYLTRQWAKTIRARRRARKAAAA